MWTTINEPRFVIKAYGDEQVAPALGSQFSGIVDYMALRNVLLAHAAAYRIYEKSYKEQQKGEALRETFAFFSLRSNFPRL
jgi:beta-glucosidase/6-phospho-beta-glucosidase/beta-galactosidase